MANPELLERLKQGAGGWNAWRSENRGVYLDLSEANLKEADLSGANLSGADLSGADLSGADLIEANLSGADLSGADLSGADLIEANLSGADLIEAHLIEANLSEADLSGADLDSADLDSAILSRTILSRAILKNTAMNSTTLGELDLRFVKGLETVRHYGPSTLSTSTLEISQGEIPEVFLRGIGLNDTLIEYVRSLVSRPIEYYTCFLSYASANKTFAKRLHADLQGNGVRCWFAPEDLKIGDHYHQRIDESIRLYDKLILILSEHAVQSVWVEREVVAAREKEDQLGRAVLFPIRLDDAVMQTTNAWAADVRRRWHIGDFTQWKHHDAYQVAFERLLRDLKAKQTPKE